MRNPETITVAGETVEVARLVEAVSGLCQARQEAATDPTAAKATYDRRAQYGIDTASRALQPSYSRLASSMTQAVERVQAHMTTAGATLAHDLARLTALLRDGLARLGITTEACAS